MKKRSYSNMHRNGRSRQETDHKPRMATHQALPIPEIHEVSMVSTYDGPLCGVSDLHVSQQENRRLLASHVPSSPSSWLLIAGDVGESVEEIRWALTVLAQRYRTLVWVPGNHELWSHPQDPNHLRGEAKYRHLVEICRTLGIHTPEDPYPVWRGSGGAVTIAPLFLLYDYTYLPARLESLSSARARAEEAGVVCTDEFLLHPDPYPDLATWSRQRVDWTRRRLDACDPDLPLVLVNHFPLLREPTRALIRPEFALWCGTTATADWHRRYPVRSVVYGHLHIRRTTWHDGVPHQEVSLGYARQWRFRGAPVPLAPQILLRERAS